VKLRAVQWPARLATATWGVTLGVVLADAWSRHEIAVDDRFQFWWTAITLTLAVVTVVAACAGALVAASFACERWLAPIHPGLGKWGAWLVLAVGPALAVSDTAHWVFRGKVDDGWAWRMTPELVLAAVGVTALVCVLATRWALRRVASGRTFAASALAASYVALAIALVVADTHLFVSLYSRVHAVLEVVAMLFGLAGLTVLTVVVERRWARTRWVEYAALLLALGITVRLAWSEPSRAQAREVLGPAQLDPVYLGRMLKRLSYAEAAVKGGLDERAIASHQVDALLARYDVETATKHPMWDAAFDEPDVVTKELARLRGGQSDLNVVVFYVDTMRRDVAYDPAIMPNLAAFSERAIRFDRAYSSGSDTLSALPGMVSGTYDAEPDRSVMDTASEYGIASALVIPESAYEFLAKLLPLFHFEETVRIEDYHKAGVWGYGADVPTAGTLVDGALAWMSDHSERRFLLWLFNFDVHNWRSLDKTYLQGMADRFQMTDDGSGRFHYDVAARGVDEAFGRLVEGIEGLGLADRTVILFVSDHGEGLGYYDFWVHSVFLWEPLVRVPIVLRMPGVQAAVVDAEVSTLDVAPTLTRFLGDDPVLRRCHGEDLLSYLVPDRPRRRLPILFRATKNLELERVGLVEDGWKLVLKTDWSDPELYDLSSDSPDDTDVSRQHPARTLELFGTLVRSPMFARAYEEIVEAREAP
jgi:hypothetical protein